MSRISRGVAVALVLLTVGGCSSAAIDGQGSVASVQSSGSAAPSITSFPSSTPATVLPDTGTSVPTETPASTPTRSSVPAQPAVKVCPKRSKPPFCYALPSGFRNFSDLGNYGKGWMYRTLVSAGLHDLIEVLGSRVKTSYDRLDNRELQKYFHQYLRAKPGRYSVRHAGPARRTQVDGARAFEQHVVFTDGVHGDTTTVFRGRTAVSISCQSQEFASRVAAACGAVHRSIHIG